MKTTMKKVIALVLAAVMLFGLVACGPSSSAGEDEVYELNLSCPDPQGSLVANILDEFVAEVKEASNGRLEITVFYGGALATPTDALDQLEAGAFDLMWGGTAHTPGRFPNTEVLALPQIGYTNNVHASVALEELIKTNADVAKEFENIHVLTVHCGAENPITYIGDKEIQTLADLKGLRIRVLTPSAVTFLNELGASPMSFSINDSYENMSKGVCDGVVNDWNALAAFKIFDLGEYIMDISVTMTLMFIGMNKDSYNELPADLQTVLDDVASGYGRKLAQGFYDAKQDALKVCEENGIVVYAPGEELEKAMDAAAAVAMEEWVAQQNATGVDADKILADAIAILEAHAAEFAN